MNNKKEHSKYGTSIDISKVIKRRKRRPEYTECLQDFLESGENAWEVNTDVLPSKKPRVVLSSLNWRIRKFPEFKGVKAFMANGKIYLKRVDENG